MISRREAFALLTEILSGGHFSDAKEAKEIKSEDFKQLMKAVQQIQQDLRQLADALYWSQLTSPPIGCVEAYPGPWPGSKPDGTDRMELDIGWLLCDGRDLDTLQDDLHKELRKRNENIPEGGVLAELRALLPKVKVEKGEQLVEMDARTLPDYRGRFLRGVNRGVNGSSAELSGVDQSLREVGIPQDFTTAAPKKSLTIKNPGAELKFGVLAHSYYGRRVPPDQTADYLVSRGGQQPPYSHPSFSGHTHELEGFDDETRPYSCTVNYIIKFQ